jgi:hypothetical protein
MVLELLATAPSGGKVHYISAATVTVDSTSSGGMEHHLSLLSIIMCNCGSKELLGVGSGDSTLGVLLGVVRILEMMSTRNFIVGCDLTLTITHSSVGQYVARI